MGLFQRSAFLLVAVCGLLLVGCDAAGPKYFPVSGTVQFKKDGSKAQFGSVEFRSETDPPVIARGKIESDGTFSINASDKTGTVEGTHTVVIIQVIGDSRTRRVIHNHGLDVAKKYGDHRTTDLKVDVNQETAGDLLLLVDSTDD